jgi:hypothetical protein
VKWILPTFVQSFIRLLLKRLMSLLAGTTISRQPSDAVISISPLS